MLRAKRITPIRTKVADKSALNPLHDLSGRFVRWTIAIGLSEATAATRQSALDHFVHWCDANDIASPRDITRDALEAYQAALATYRKRNGEALERATQATRLNPVKAFCKWLVRSRLVDLDPARDLELPKLPRRLPRRIPSIDEVRRILSGVDGSAPSGIRDRAMMETL